MNKKIIIIIVAVILLAAIGLLIYFNSTKEKEIENANPNSNENNTPIDNNEEDNNEEENNENENINSDNKIAILYFSATGTTKTVAEYIEEATDGNLIEIVPKNKYTSADLNYNNDDCRANKEQNDSNARPEIDGNINIDDYDIIYLGYPIWWGDVPKIILTFLDSYDLSGKTVIPFCTSGGSGIGTSMNTLRNYNKNVNWIDGRRLSTSQSEITNWVNGLNY